jgi:hypothetical protein
MKTQPKAFRDQAGKGRPKGAVNKTTKLAKQAIAEAFEQLGGKDALVAWAKKDDDNLKVFYATIWPKIIPLQVEADVTGEHHHTHEPAGLSDALAWLAAARGETQETAH